MSVTDLPFTNNVLPPSECDNGGLLDLLPATRRTKDGNITPVQPTHEFLRKELVPETLENMRGWLWLAGRPTPPRPLHDQLVHGREIILSENIDLHLIWSYHAQLFVKPMPRYLLNTEFWTTHILPSKPTGDVNDLQLAAAARGFLFSYTALIAYESDFRIAKDKGLLPDEPELNWRIWRRLCNEYLANHCYAAISTRYCYGELRLTRLNTVAMFKPGSFIRGYSTVASPKSYGQWIRKNSAILTTMLGYVVIVLTAMQVGLGTDRLVANGSFQNASWGFTVFSMISPLIIAAMGLGYLLIVVIINWMATTSTEAQRFRAMGIEPPRKVPKSRS